MKWLKNLLSDNSLREPTPEDRIQCLEMTVAEQRGHLAERATQIKRLEAKLEGIEANGGYGYRQQHFEWLNKETLRLSHMVRELSENNEKLNSENMELTEALKKAKSRKKNNE
jgi:hypothetical protein